VRPGGQPNMQQLMKQAQQMQQQLVDAQAELAETDVTGTSGGGLVTVTMRATGEVSSVKIDPKAVDADDVETLEDLVLAAIHAATGAAAGAKNSRCRVVSSQPRVRAWFRINSMNGAGPHT